MARAWGCRHLPGHQSVMLSPPRNLDLGAAGRELDDDRFAAEPLQTIGVPGMLPAETVDRYQFIADQSGALVQTRTSANPAAGTALPFRGSDRRCRRRAPGSLGRILRLPFEPPPASEHQRGERHDDDQITTRAASLVTLIGRDPPTGVAWSRWRPALGWRTRKIVRCRLYQGTGVPSQEKNSPDGPSSGSSASRTTPAAASAGSPSLAAAAVLRSVRRRPGASALTLMPSSAKAWVIDGQRVQRCLG